MTSYVVMVTAFPPKPGISIKPLSNKADFGISVEEWVRLFGKIEATDQFGDLSVDVL